ncbi:MAG: hypothetical protein KDA79_00020 [Planctomycetaceae bacterium]|nr:hypothetical protein [Planctomycetaceae bacterium]
MMSVTLQLRRRNDCRPQRLSPSDIPVKSLCPFCSQPVHPEDQRCAECGADLRPDAGPSPENTGETTETSPAEPPPAERIAGLLLEGRRVQAVREWQQATGCDLVEAVVAVDRISDRAGIARPRGCAGVLLLLAAILSACLVTAA